MYILVAMYVMYIYISYILEYLSNHGYIFLLMPRL